MISFFGTPGHGSGGMAGNPPGNYLNTWAMRRKGHACTFIPVIPACVLPGRPFPVPAEVFRG
ncbi:hypothetical protein EAJ17_11620 [Akkermansia sp. aa_0143]|nr:hypothetical protein EAJ17_11620 [Akkermansia sp. aa_0143]